MARRGRKVGSLVRAKCILCGAVELARGGARYRCSECAVDEPSTKGKPWFVTVYIGHRGGLDKTRVLAIDFYTSRLSRLMAKKQELRDT